MTASSGTSSSSDTPSGIPPSGTPASGTAASRSSVSVAATKRFSRGRRSSARRRRRSSALVMVLGLLATGVLWTVLAPGGNAAQTPDANEAVRQGRALYLQGCSTCHGLGAQGTNTGPSLIGVGAAAVDFQVSTGRMPLAAPAAQADRKPPIYSATQIDQLAAYIQSLGGGEEVPKVTDAALNDADLSHGGELYRANCAQCHQAVGQGAPLTYGKFAPSLSEATPVQVVEAMRTGPESMPVFGPRQLNEEDATAIAAYIKHMKEAPSAGGYSLGNYGPVPEGLLAWLVGVGALLGVCLWIGARQKV
ncbi:c-type cytochrome [Frankia sp. B2]|uniref:Cytochrome bc1 complex cytochrome c subunit n=2 Tax=Frankia casuarinae (strain DSM 45818 / CECT 9043 / HFP020203 / CcI3) TaxID=106370 RepID=Q2J8C8_FRACC|nr:MULTISPECIES: c-type cytochrome [Frankia]ABD12464.1 menaquinol-cytochrome c reductase cytochrome c1 subunit precursor [Frankia casuarinae]ORT95933.1 cytochrome C [Frankia casuarinae]TFE33482.1 c-type cytochrome [Frankia sp. B2]